MTSWINAHPIKRIFKEKIEKKEKTKNCYEPYLFNSESGRSISNNIRKFGIYLTDIKKIVNVYKPYYKKIPASGLGDFIRGSYFLYQYCKLLDIEFEVNNNQYRYRIVGADNSLNLWGRDSNQWSNWSEYIFDASGNILSLKGDYANNAFGFDNLIMTKKGSFIQSYLKSY